MSIDLSKVSDVHEVEYGAGTPSTRKNYEGGFAKKVGAISPDLGFFVNKEAMEDNKFIKEEYINMSEEESTAKAKEAFDKYVDDLKDNGIDVEVFHQSTKAADSVFPDWFTT